MKKIVKAASTNCSVCGREVLNYQIRTAQLGSVLKEMCKSCHSGTSAYKKFAESLEILKELQKNILYSCLLVNNNWCDIAISILLKSSREYFNWFTRQSLHNVIISHLSNETKENLKNQGIDLGRFKLIIK
jgi:hypothetical protein